MDTHLHYVTPLHAVSLLLSSDTDLIFQQGLYIPVIPAAGMQFTVPMAFDWSTPPLTTVNFTVTAQYYYSEMLANGDVPLIYCLPPSHSLINPHTHVHTHTHVNAYVHTCTYVHTHVWIHSHTHHLKRPNFSMPLICY